MSQRNVEAGPGARPIVQPITGQARWPVPLVESAAIALILVIGAYLRFSHLDLLEFQGDEAYAANLALKCVREGALPSAGLMSSVGVTNPPLFIYLLIPMFAISPNPVFVSCCIAVLGLAAVGACWWIGRKYYGSIAGLTAAAFFAVSPWAVIYSRKVWAQDFVPVFATATMWAMHALVLGKKPKAVFWAVLLPLCVIQIHFSGLALTATVLAILLWLRPKIDWRFAAAGLVTALVVMVPYLQLQSKTGWADFRRAMNTVGGGQQWEQLRGITTHPVTGYRLPSKQNVSYALAIMNAGRIEDVLGVNAHERIGGDIYKRKGITYERFFFRKNFAGRNGMARVLVDAALVVHRLLFAAALVWLAVLACRGVRKWKVQEQPEQAAWILVLWLIVPLLVFWTAGLWVYLTYFVILYPVHFLICGAAMEKLGNGSVGASVGASPSLRRWLVTVVVSMLLAGNAAFMLDYYQFVQQNGGAQGTFGTALGIKQQAARFLAEQGGSPLREACKTQLAFATAQTQEERAALAGRIGRPQLVELNHEGQAELPQLEWPLLVTQQPAGPGAWPTNMTVVLVDGNREALQPQQWQQLEQLPKTNFGSIRIYFVKR